MAIEPKPCQAGRTFQPDVAQFALDRIAPRLDWETPCPEAASHLLVLDFEQAIALCCPHMHTINEALVMLDEERRAADEQRRMDAQYN